MIDADDFSQKLNRHRAAVSEVNAQNKAAVLMPCQPQASPMSWSRSTARVIAVRSNP